jgi:hypothetical protein
MNLALIYLVQIRGCQDPYDLGIKSGPQSWLIKFFNQILAQGLNHLKNQQPLQ